ncbi:MAG TPA: PKD domain-containing protein [Bacteroidia bacterium]|nr:PKD domain-containing protein [Bacteroidia bacterium]
MRYLLHICFGLSFLLIPQQSPAQFYAECKRAFAQVDLDINNVRALLRSSGDLWGSYDEGGQYEIPKGSGAKSLFFGNIWIGGIDGGGQLHVAAGTYGQNGKDFWPGPLDTLSAGVLDSTCNDYDRFWKLDRAEVESFIMNRNDPNYVIPEAILSWPGNGNTTRGIAHVLAPFHDVDGDRIYDPMKGDYPDFSFNGQNNCAQNLLGDQAIWWVFNDKGNDHTESGGEPLGVEVQATAFAYRSSNEHLDNATFYRYKVINRSNETYNNMWFANWTDYDLGDAFDDFVGCDVARGLGYCYNGRANDGGMAQPNPGTYGAHPPAIGLDYLGGPFAEDGDGIDNDRDMIVDEPDEQISLACSHYYDNDFRVNGNPETAEHYYDFMSERFKDGTHMTYGGNGYGGAYPSDYFYPGDSDPYGWGTYGVILPPWTETTTGNMWGDRRQLNSVGPFSMEPGEVEVITIGVPWARDMNGDNLDAIDRLKEADDYIQTLFDNCFSVPCVDQALPEIQTVVDTKLAYFTLYASGTAWSWDFGDGNHSAEKHPSHYYSSPGTYYPTVHVTTACGTLSDVDTVVIKDELNAAGPAIWRLEGQGNGKQELEFAPETIEEILTSPDHRSLFPKYEPLHAPVLVTYENYDALEDGEYRIALDSTHAGAHWKIWKVGGADTVFSDSSIQNGEPQRLNMWGLGIQMTHVDRIGYDANPDQNGYLTSSITFADPAKNWLSGIQDHEGYRMDNWIRSGEVSVSATFIETCVTDFNDRFLGITPLDANENFEQVIGGTWAPYRLASYAPTATQTVICYSTGPAWKPNPFSAGIANKIENLANVDVVFTSDQSKWTRCPVIETGSNNMLNEGGVLPFMLRSGLSVDKQGRTITNGGISDPANPEAADYIGATGMGWFPGYAINLETGERLNMAFGENSAYVSEHGRDMLWNPTENSTAPFAGDLWGGLHYVYVFGHNGDALFPSGVLTGELSDVPMYDAGKMMHTIFTSSSATAEMRAVYSDAMWTTIPVLQSGHSLLECDVTVKLRVQKPYAKYMTDSVPLNRNFPLYGLRINKSDLGFNVYDGAVNVYPNPFAEECMLQFDNTDNHVARVELFDIQGRLVRTYENITGDRVIISGAGLYSGVYIWSLQLEGTEDRVGKIVLK